MTSGILKQARRIGALFRIAFFTVGTRDSASPSAACARSGSRRGHSENAFLFEVELAICNDTDFLHCFAENVDLVVGQYRACEGEGLNESKY